jgi:hypothetical protein
MTKEDEESQLGVQRYFVIRHSSFTAAFTPPLNLHHLGFFALEVIVD